MRSKISLLLTTVAILFLQSCSSQKLNHAEQIIAWINGGQKDSLRANLHDEFIFELREAPRDNFKNADFFLTEFMQNQGFLEGKYKIDKLEHETGKEDGKPVDMYQVYSTYNNIYQKYLKVPPYKSLIKMEFNQGKLGSISFGTADKSQSEVFQEELKKFNTWLREKYPDESFNDMMKKKDKLLIERMKEFKKDN